MRAGRDCMTCQLADSWGIPQSKTCISECMPTPDGKGARHQPLNAPRPASISSLGQAADLLRQSGERISQLSAAQNKLVDEVLRLRGLHLTDQRIDHIAELVLKGMPDGLAGFAKTWGWRQFARALLADCGGHHYAPVPWEEVLKLLNQYAMGVTDAALHQSASRADIAQSQAAQALVQLRRLYCGDDEAAGQQVHLGDENTEGRA